MAAPAEGVSATLGQWGGKGRSGSTWMRPEDELRILVKFQIKIRNIFSDGGIKIFQSFFHLTFFFEKSPKKNIFFFLFFFSFFLFFFFSFFLFFSFSLLSFSFLLPFSLLFRLFGFFLFSFYFFLFSFFFGGPGPGPILSQNPGTFLALFRKNTTWTTNCANMEHRFPRS